MTTERDTTNTPLWMPRNLPEASAFKPKVTGTAPAFDMGDVAGPQPKVEVPDLRHAPAWYIEEFGS